MTITARHYRDQNDLTQIQALLAAGRLADNRAYYVHSGDLGWWLYNSDENIPDRICLWEWNSNLAGLSLLSNSHHSFEVFVQPEFRGSSLEAKILLWAEATQANTLKGLNTSQIRTMWVAETDKARIQWLKLRGFRPRSERMFLMQRSLAGAFPAIKLPEGYNIRHSMGKQDASSRAIAAHAIFNSEMGMDEYLSQVVEFMESPVYDPGNDILVTSPDGEISSFCLLWPDPVTRVGLFKPVGTHPCFRRLGLAKAVVTAGLQRLQDLGMTHASLCVKTDNLPAIQLYEGLDFKKTKQLLTFEKPLL